MLARQIRLVRSLPSASHAFPLKKSPCETLSSPHRISLISYKQHVTSGGRRGGFSPCSHSNSLVLRTSVTSKFSSTSRELPTKCRVDELLLQPNVVLMDVREAHEVAQPPHLPPALNNASTGTRFVVVHCPASLSNASSVVTDDFLASHAILPDTPVVVFCRSGRRAGVALAALKSLGCKHAANGGGVEDVLAALSKINKFEKTAAVAVASSSATATATVGNTRGADTDATDGNDSPTSSESAWTPLLRGAAVAPPSSPRVLPLFLGRAGAALDPYVRLVRLDKPIGTLLLVWPCAWSIALAAPLQGYPDLHTLCLFAGGALVMRGAGCTINDWWDRDVDKFVERTSLRPIASGEVSPNAALALFGAQCGVGLGVLLQLPLEAVALGSCAVPLVVVYPLAKRFTTWPQLVLGVTYNWGALLGGLSAQQLKLIAASASTSAAAASTTAKLLTGPAAAAAAAAAALQSTVPAVNATATAAAAATSTTTTTGVALLASMSSSLPPLPLGDAAVLASEHMSLSSVWAALPEWALPLYGGCVCWTLVYDTLYAHQDKVDDRRLGLHSTALTFGDSMTKPVLLGFSVLTVGGIGAAGHMAGLSIPFYAALGAGGAQLGWQVAGAKLDDPQDLWKRFVSNNWFGATILVGIVAGHF